MSLAANMPLSSSKVSTKSTSERMSSRMASSFFAAQGPTKTILALGFVSLTSLAVMTMGVSAEEMFSSNSGKSFSAIMRHAGQHEVAMKSSFSGTFSMKS